VEGGRVDGARADASRRDGSRTDASRADASRADANRQSDPSRVEANRAEVSREERARRLNDTARSPGGLYERGVKQRQKREAAISRRRREREAAELESCTFTPAIKTVVDKEGREVVKYLEPQSLLSKNTRGRSGARDHPEARQGVSPDRYADTPVAMLAENARSGGGGSSGSGGGGGSMGAAPELPRPSAPSPDRHRRSEAPNWSQPAEGGGDVPADGNVASLSSAATEGAALNAGGAAEGDGSNRSGGTSDTGRGHQTSVVIMSAISSAVMSALPRALDSYRERRHSRLHTDSRQHSERSSERQLHTPHGLPLPPPVSAPHPFGRIEESLQYDSLEATPPTSPEELGKHGVISSAPPPASAPAALDGWAQAATESLEDSSATDVDA